MILTRRLPGLVYTHRHCVYTFVLLLATLVYLLFRWNLLCANFQAWQHVSRICKLHEDGDAVGSLCAPLCTTQEIHSLTCHSFHASKEAVFSAEWHETRLVFKSTSSEVQALHWYDNGLLKYPTEKEFLSTIRAVVRSKLNLTLPYDSAIRLSRLKPSFEEKDAVKRHKEMDSIWMLIQDNEYLISTLFADKDVFPQLLGTCGPYFAVEYMEPIQDASTLLSIGDTREDWGRRLKVSNLILDLLEELETGFKEPFHLCDVKLQHFGMVKGGTKLKFIDLNGVYPKSVISKIISRQPSCEKDADCDLYDCRGRCNKERKKCASSVANNNFQIVCEKIFLGWRLSSTVLVPGLLMSEHTPSALASILRQCSNPDMEDGNPRGVPDEELKKRLVNVVSEVEQSVNNDFFL